MKKLIISQIILVSAISYGQIPQSLYSKNLKIYTDGKETENMGYGNWNIYEDGEYLMIKNFIKKGDTVIDAGAHTGDWSGATLEHTNNQCRLFAFEPVPFFFKQLTTKRQNRANCFNQALGNTQAQVMMNYYYFESEGCSSLFDREVLSSIPVQKITISVTSLDRFCSDNSIEYIDFLKIDTEGSEWNVLQGADHLISSKKIQVIQFEYGGTYRDAQITLYQVYSYLNSKGYEIFRITADGLIHISAWREALENFQLSNYLAIFRDSL